MVPDLAAHDLDALVARVLLAVDATAYQSPAGHVEPGQRAAMREIEAAIQVREFDPARARALAHRLHAAGRIDRVHYLSALHVIAAHPAVADYAEAARLCGEQEVAALELGGPGLDANMASVDRHRGVLAYVRRVTDRCLLHRARRRLRERAALTGPAVREIASWHVAAPPPGADLPEDVENPLHERDQAWLRELFTSGSMAEHARRTSVSRAAVTLRVQRIRARIEALTPGERDAAEGWLEQAAREAVATRR